MSAIAAPLFGFGDFRIVTLSYDDIKRMAMGHIAELVLFGK